MTAYLTDSLFELATNGEFKQFFIQLFNSYTPYGAFWWLLGFTIAFVAHKKSENYMIAGAIGALYFMIMPATGLVVNAYAVQAMRYFGLALGVATGAYAYKILKG